MRHCTLMIPVMTLTLFLLSSRNAFAQQASSFEQLQSIVKPGDIVEVIGTDGKSTKGKIESLSAASLRLATKAKVHEFSQRDTVEVRQRRPDSLANGALKGALIAAGAGVALEAVYSADYSGHGGGTRAAVELAIATGVGAGIGIGVDAMITQRKAIYRAAVTSALGRVGVSPLIAGERRGARLSFSF